MNHLADVIVAREVNGHQLELSGQPGVTSRERTGRAGRDLSLDGPGRLSPIAVFDERPDNRQYLARKGQEPAQGESVLAPSLCSIVAFPQYINQGDAIIGYPTLKALLQPKHKYFKDKQAYVWEFKAYKHAEGDEHSILYAVVKADDAFATRNNPYRKYQLARSHAGRTVGQLTGVIGKQGFDDFRLADLVFTMPQQMSRQLADLGKRGRGIAWRCFNRLFDDSLPGVLNRPGAEFASCTNLHTWRTEEPLKPHFHFHSQVPNYVSALGTDRVLIGGCEYYPAERFEKWFGGGIVKRYFDKDRGKWRFGCVPFSGEELEDLKRSWTKILRDTAHRNGLKVDYFKDTGALADVYVGFSGWDDNFGRARFIHKINYQKRSWVEDYCRYSNENTDCANPPGWLEHYANRSRPRGWWLRLKELGEGIDKKTDRISPITGEPMVYCGTVSHFAIPERLVTNLAGLEIVNGRVVSWLLDDREKEWLAQACRLELEFDILRNGASFEPGGDDG